MLKAVLCGVFLAFLAVALLPQRAYALTFDGVYSARHKAMNDEKKLETFNEQEPCGPQQDPTSWELTLTQSQSYTFTFEFGTSQYCTLKFSRSTSGTRSLSYSAKGAVAFLPCGTKAIYPQAQNWVEVWHCDDVELQKCYEKTDYTVNEQGLVGSYSQLDHANRFNYLLSEVVMPRYSQANYPDYTYPRPNPCTMDVWDCWYTPGDCSSQGLPASYVGTHYTMWSIGWCANG